MNKCKMCIHKTKQGNRDYCYKYYALCENIQKDIKYKYQEKNNFIDRFLDKHFYKIVLIIIIIILLYNYYN